MKKALLILFFLQLSNILFSQTISRSVISAGGGSYNGADFSVNYTIGETMTNTLSGSETTLTQGFQQPDDLWMRYVLNMRAFLEGFYVGGETMAPSLFNLGISNDPTATDSIQVDLWSTNHLSNSIPDFSSNALLHTNGQAEVVFPDVYIGNNYFLSVKHRNGIETWSSSPIVVTDGSAYNFTTGMNKAYDNGINNPMKNIENGVYAIYSGDVNQDGALDIFDMSNTENDAFNFQFGYNATDCNGDGATDALDMQLIENNAMLQIYFARP